MKEALVNLIKLEKAYFEELIDTVIIGPYNTLRFYVRNRFIDRLHYLPTKLPRGKYFDLDHRMLHAMFEALVDFIEYEKASLYTWCHNSELSSYPWWTRFLKRWYNYRLPEAGLAYLTWEMSLVYDGNDDSLFGQPTKQAIAAKEQYELYKWWKEQYPKRQDPYITDDDYTNVLKIEAGLYEEEQQMLLRLINIRSSLWT